MLPRTRTGRRASTRSSSGCRSARRRLREGDLHRGGALPARHHRCPGLPPGWMGAEHGVNEAGVAVGNATIYTTLDPRGAPAALTGYDRFGWRSGGSHRGRCLQVIIDLLGATGRWSGYEQRAIPIGRRSSSPTPIRLGCWRHPDGRGEWQGRPHAGDDKPHHDLRVRRGPTATRASRSPRWSTPWKASQAVLAAEPVGPPDLKAHLRIMWGMALPWACTPTTRSPTRRWSWSWVRNAAPPTCFGLALSLRVRPTVLGRSIGTRSSGAVRRAAALAQAALDELERDLAADAEDDDSWGEEAWRRVDAVLNALGA